MGDYGHAATIAAMPRCPQHPDRRAWFVTGHANPRPACGECAE